MKKILLTRPQADSERIAPDFEALGYDIEIAPVLEIHLFDPDIPLCDVVCLSSKNALPTLEKLSKATPVFCVGAYTASLVARLGFETLSTAPTAESLLELLQKETAELLYLAGTHNHLDFSQHLTNCKKVICYEARAVEKKFEEDVTHIPLYSVRSAALFNKHLRKNKISLKAVTFLALSQDIAHVIKELDCKEILVAEHPTHQALLNLLVRKNDAS